MTLPLTVDTMLPARRQLRSELFGTLEVTDDDLMEFGDGLLGFPECRTWALLRGTKEGTAWLQSAEHAALIFLLVDPFVFFVGYSAELSVGELQRLRATTSDEIAVFAIVTLPLPGQPDCTANLQGPVVMNLLKKRGVQVVLGDGPFGLRAPIPLDALL
jgi:flagellar assembly factor FliW